MPPPTSKPTGAPSDRRRLPSKDPDGGDAPPPPSLNLWVGNLSSDTSESDLMAAFGTHGALDAVAAHAPRPYAFVYFRRIDDARAAMDALRGTMIRGTPISIRFARLAKPGKHLWIGGISSSVTKEQLEDAFLKFGKIEEYKFLRDRNSAFIDYYNIEDSITAQKNMNGKQLAGEEIRVDFQRSQPSKREWPDRHNARDGRFNHRRGMEPRDPWMPPDGMRNFHDSSQHGTKRHPPSGGRRGGHPSNTLWIGYPPSVHIDEQMLHNAMILFGEIERINNLPSKHYSFVEFRSIDEARRAKEALQGRLFNDPRIQIMFSSSELVPNKDNPPAFPGFRGARPEMFLDEAPFGTMELFGPGRPMAPNNFPGQLLPNGIPGPNIFMRPFAAQGFDHHHGGPEFHDFNDHKFPDGNPINPMDPNLRRLSPPAPGMLPSAPGMWPPFRPMPGEQGGFDMREPKRSRIDGPYSTNDASRRADGETMGNFFGLLPPDRVISAQSHYNPVVRNPGALHGSADNDLCWRGIIAKGGTPVCHARCVPMGKGMDSPFPEIVNCSARTGLDMLTKHYAEAVGFDIVFFLPDTEEDFASYTEFLHYLALKNRAGVAKFDDGTTLFLVPPSDFLTNVLNVSGPERLYGVVLKLSQQTTSATLQQPQLIVPPQPHYFDRQPEVTSQKGYNLVPQNGDQAMKMNHGYVSNPEAASQVEVSLTPELLATLASLIPAKVQQSTNETIYMPSSSSVMPTSFPASVIHDRPMPSQGSSREHQASVMNSSSISSQVWSQEHVPTFAATPLEQTNILLQQIGHQFRNQMPLISQFPTYPNMPNGPDYSGQPVVTDTQIRNSNLNMPQVSDVPSSFLNNYLIPFQSGPFLTPQSNQQYQLDSSNSHKNHGMLQTADAAAIYPPVQQQPNPTTTANSQIGNVPQTQIVMPVATDKLNNEFSAQLQQLPTALPSSGQGTSEGDADKNQRYQSTLQYAASLILQLQQQQQAGAQALQGSQNQQ